MNKLKGISDASTVQKIETEASINFAIQSFFRRYEHGGYISVSILHAQRIQWAYTTGDWQRFRISDLFINYHRPYTLSSQHTSI